MYHSFDTNTKRPCLSQGNVQAIIRVAMPTAFRMSDQDA